jgi:ABC-type branched-subunit amino acid transport system ATPase component
MKNIVVETKALTKTYEGIVPVYAVRGADVTIEDNEFTAIIGPIGQR